nr:hypothetical protein [Amycolatopsis sp. GM8]
MFLDQDARALFVDWPDQARAATPTPPPPPSSPNYANTAVSSTNGGNNTAYTETLTPPGDPDMTLYIYTTEPDSPSRRAIDLLASWTAANR